MSEAEEPRVPGNDPKFRGVVDIAIGVIRTQKGPLVKLDFNPTPIPWLAMGAENSRVIAEAIGRASYEARYGVAPQATGSVMAAEKLDILTTRCSLVLKNQMNAKVKPETIARQLIEIVMREVG